MRDLFQPLPNPNLLSSSGVAATAMTVSVGQPAGFTGDEASSKPSFKRTFRLCCLLQDVFFAFVWSKAFL